MIVAIGTSGDVFPMIGLGRAMQDRGHEVHLASLPEHQGAIQGARLAFHALEGIPGTLEAPDIYHPTRGMRVVAERVLIPAMRPVYDLLSGLNPDDWMVTANVYSYGARLAQEKFGFWLTTYVVSPFCLPSLKKIRVTPGVAFPPWAPVALWPPFFKFVSRLWDRELAPPVNSFRQALGLAPVNNIWYEWSLSPDRVIGLFPEWFAPNPGDWPEQFVYGGFTVFGGGAFQELPAELLEAGDPLVVFAAGSAGLAAADFFQNAVAASAGQPWRAVLLTGKHTDGFTTPLPANVHRFDFVSMSKLLPVSSLVVHHGGLGTMSLALASGTPQIAVPLGHDQFDNAARIEELGVGRGVMNSPSRLQAAIRRMLNDPSWSVRCRSFTMQATIDGSFSRLCEQIEMDDRERLRRSPKRDEVTS